MSPISPALFKSSYTEWETPQPLFDELDREFHFSLDVCATEFNTKCFVFFSPEMDGLKQDWGGQICWMNPPYGRAVKNWVKKAYESSLTPGTVVVCLLPARTDTGWWHDYVEPYASEIRFLRGRLKFVGADNSAPFPSVVVIFDGRN